MKVLYLFNGDKVTNQTLWSGTVSRFYKLLNKQNDVIAISTNVLIIDIIEKILKKIFRREFLFLLKIKSNYLKKKIKKINFDYIFYPAGAKILAYLKIDKPIIYLADATYHLMENYYYNDKPFMVKIKNKIDYNAIHNSTKIIVSSEWCRNDMVDFYHCNPSKIEVIPFYTDFNINNNIIKTNKDNYNFLLVGVDWKRKGVEIAINAIKYLNEELGIKSNLNIIGLDAPSDKDYVYCNFYGFLNKNDTKQFELINELYSSADLFILPTIAECAGIVFAEASGYGLPILTFDTGGVSTYVINDYNGYRLSLNSTYVDFANKAKYIIENKLISKLSKNSHDLYNLKFTENSYLKKYNLFIKDIN